MSQIDDEETPVEPKYKCTIPKRMPPWLFHLFDYLREECNMALNVELIKKQTKDNWAAFQSLGKKRQTRRKEKPPTEVPHEEPETNQNILNMTQSTIPQLFGSDQRFVDEVSLPLTSEQWRKRPRDPSMRIRDDYGKIENVFKKMKLPRKSGPFRALEEMKLSIQKVMEKLPESEKVIEAEIVNGDLFEQEIDRLEKVDTLPQSNHSSQFATIDSDDDF